MNIKDLAHKETKSLHERIGSHDSFFEIELNDGHKIHESDTNWSDISETREINGKTVHICNYPIKSIRIRHGGIETTLDVPSGHGVFQAILSQTIFLPFSAPQTKHIGRIVGLVKDGTIIEERVVDSESKTVRGYKK